MEYCLRNMSSISDLFEKYRKFVYPTPLHDMRNLVFNTFLEEEGSDEKKKKKLFE